LFFSYFEPWKRDCSSLDLIAMLCLIAMIWPEYFYLLRLPLMARDL